MNILFFISSMNGGGAERVTATLANYWAAKGWNVTVVTIAGTEADFYTLDTSIQRESLNLAVESAGLVVALRNNVRRLRALRRVLKSVRPDVAVGMMSTSNVLLALAARGLPIVTIGSERIYPPMMPLGRVWEALRRMTYSKLSALVAQTGDSAAWLQIHAPAKRIAVIPNPVTYPMECREPTLSPATFLADMGARHLLLAVGRLGLQKGFDRLIQAFRKCAEFHPDWVLVILGEGAQRQELEALVRDEGLSGRVALPGAVRNVGDWYEAAHLYALTSRFEGFPNVLVEAMAHGLPVVAVDCDTGPRDIVVDHVNGLLVPQGDASALERALGWLMSDDMLRERMAEEATKIRTRFSLPSVVSAWESLFPCV